MIFARELCVADILKNCATEPSVEQATAFAPSNIALVKYWGKRDSNLNLPMTDSLSISLNDRGATTTISVVKSSEDQVLLNGEMVDKKEQFYQRLVDFLALFRHQTGHYYRVETNMNLPVAAGLASSACGFAAVVKALDQLYQWQLSTRALSILARMGSGSAARSIETGFVYWHAGRREDGQDSYAEKLQFVWPDLSVGLLIVTKQPKPIDSRTAMQRTVDTAALYQAWPQQVAQDMVSMQAAIRNRDFDLLGKTAENNALAMHATMQASWPPIVYSHARTHQAMQQVWQLRDQGIAVYFTQDAGPNLKLLFLNEHLDAVKDTFADLECC